MKRFACALLIVASAAIALANGPVEMDVSPAFIGPLNRMVNAYEIRITNPTDLAQNVDVRVVGGPEYTYHVKPKGIVKFLAFQPQGQSQVGGQTIHMAAAPAAGRGQSSDIASKFMGDAEQQAPSVLEISDHKTLGWFFGHSGPFGLSELYSCRPGAAPDRPAAYKGFSAVILRSSDSRGLTDGAVDALKDYVVEGGMLILAPSLDDPRLSEIALKSRYGYEGLGVVANLANDPFSATGQRAALLDTKGEAAIRAALSPKDRSWKGDFGILGYSLSRERILSIEPTSAYPDQPGPRPRVQASGPSPTTDPFNAGLPPFAKVVGLLALYFLAVVPLNLFVLKRLGKPELTWITAPVLALAFAGLLFNNSNMLGQARTSHATDGYLVMQEGLSNAVFAGTSDLYIPHSGSVDLGLHDVDELYDETRIVARDATGNSVYDSVSGAIDTGSLQVPRLVTSNLAYKQIQFVQLLRGKGWFTFRRLSKQHHYLTPIQVTNHSPYTVHHAILTYPGLTAGRPVDLMPGQSMSIPVVDLPEATLTKNDKNGSSALPVRRTATLQGEIDDDAIGPQLGDAVRDRTHIRLYAMERP